MFFDATSLQQFVNGLFLNHFRYEDLLVKPAYLLLVFFFLHKVGMWTNLEQNFCMVKVWVIIFRTEFNFHFTFRMCLNLT